MSEEHQTLVKHTGGCHCGRVRFEATGPQHPIVYNCDCSVCNKKQNRVFIVSTSKFKILQGEESITTYRFNTGVARHTFCSMCGVQSFYYPRSNPDGVGVAPHCVDKGTLTGYDVVDFDGINWEKSMATDDSIKRHSKE